MTWEEHVDACNLKATISFVPFIDPFISCIFILLFFHDENSGPYRLGIQSQIHLVSATCLIRAAAFMTYGWLANAANLWPQINLADH